MASTATATVDGAPAKHHVALDLNQYATQFREGVDTYVTKPANQVHLGIRAVTRSWFKSPFFHILLISVLVADLAIVLTEICLDVYYPEKEEEHEEDGVYVIDKCPEIPHAVERAHVALKWTSVALLIILIFEQIAKIWAFGLEYFKRLGNYLDATVVVASLVLELVLTGQNQSVAALLIFLRLIRVMHAIFTLTQNAVHEAHVQVQHANSKAEHANAELTRVKTRLTRLETIMPKDAEL